MTGAFDRARCKADRFREELHVLLIRLACINRRLSGNAGHLALKYLRTGILKDEHLVSDALRVLARLTRRAQRLQWGIADLQARF